ncbi:hypothetical protein ACFT8P_33795 [Streptomyces sp. NPDC057101]|uniref:hypothetical protein n=1 Tax=Streptomyces sp. NPDC057101 TaxID=3346020 RepID=UPI0036361FA7
MGTQTTHLPGRGLAAAVISSIGVRHDGAYAHVLKTPGALTLINRTAVQLRSLADEVPVGRLVRLTVACQGGGHRIVAAAEMVGRLIWEAWDGEYASRPSTT